VQAAAPTYDVSGTYVTNFNYLGTDHAHDMVLTQSATGTLSGHGGSPAGANVYTWVVTSGTVSGNVVDFYANYTATADAVTPLTTLHVMGAVATTGVMSGTWTTASGTAHALAGTLAAEDFGVVNYDTGLGMLKGYTAGFGLTGATLAGAQSVVVQLYSSTTLLQTNTAIMAKFNADITGTQFSTPFDVSGNFNYATDGYWVNVRAAQYGQSVPATRVVATVTLASGKVVTAENTSLTGDPTTIYPVVTLPGTLAAEDFGVVNYDTGLGMLKGYTAGFGLTSSTFAGAQSVVVKLYSSTTLMQTNTAIMSKFNADITGTQFSTPFDVSGNFNYATDGYWVNVRAAQYGQSVPATRVVATVTLANGKVVTAENTILVGNPTTIYPVVVPPPATTTAPTMKDQCKNGGWKSFTNPSFWSQGRCISYVLRLSHGLSPISYSSNGSSNYSHSHSFSHVTLGGVEIEHNNSTEISHGNGKGKGHND
jgi:Cu/Ag efflux protein CusF